MLKRMTAMLTAMLFAFSALMLPAYAAVSPTQGEQMYSDGASGDAVVRIQLRLRELGYLCYRPTGVFLGMTVEAAKEFQKRCISYGESLAVDGVIGRETMKILFGKNAPKVKIPDSVRMPRGPIMQQLKVTGQLMQWSAVREKLTVGTEYLVTDCNTGETFRLVFEGGENHAEMELASENEKAAFMKICGGEYNYLKRPVTIEIDGAQIAASIQCWPHGADFIPNNGMDGHICVYFEGSLSHVGKMPDVEHNSAVYQAAGR